SSGCPLERPSRPAGQSTRASGPAASPRAGSPAASPPGSTATACGDRCPASGFLAGVGQCRLACHVVHRGEGLDAFAGNAPRLLHDPGARAVLTGCLLLNLPEHLFREVQRLLALVGSSHGRRALQSLVEKRGRARCEGWADVVPNVGYPPPPGIRQSF